MTSALLVDDTVATSELYFDAAMPGFPSAHRFRMVPCGEVNGAFSLLQCLDREDLAFVVARPQVFFGTYAPVIGRDVAARLGIRSAEEALVLVVVTLGATPAEATVNLLGPVVVNRVTGRAAQVVLDASTYDVRTPLPRA